MCSMRYHYQLPAALRVPLPARARISSHDVLRAGLGRAYQQRPSPLDALLLRREALDERLVLIVLPVRLLHVHGVGNV